MQGTIITLSILMLKQILSAKQKYMYMYNLFITKDGCTFVPHYQSNYLAIPHNIKRYQYIKLCNTMFLIQCCVTHKCTVLNISCMINHQSSCQESHLLIIKEYDLFLILYSLRTVMILDFISFPRQANGYKMPVPLQVYTPGPYDQNPVTTSQTMEMHS